MPAIKLFSFHLLLLASLTACVAERLPPGTMSMSPQIVDSGHWQASDGFTLAFSVWPAQNPKAVIVALHGMNDYGRFIEKAALHWQTGSITTYAYDQRGFGRTEGNGRWPGAEVMARDTQEFVRLVRVRHPGTKIILLGESMGAAVAMVAAALEGEALAADAVVLTSPALWGWSNLDLIKRSALWAMMQIAPGGHLSGRGLDIRPSDNEEMLKALGADPYVLKLTRVDALYGLTGLMEKAWVTKSKMRHPALILYAKGDEVVPSWPVEEAARSMPGVKRVVVYDDGYHMLLRDLKAPRTWGEIERFIMSPP